MSNYLYDIRIYDIYSISFFDMQSIIFLAYFVLCPVIKANIVALIRLRRLKLLYFDWQQHTKYIDMMFICIRDKQYFLYRIARPT